MNDEPNEREEPDMEVMAHFPYGFYLHDDLVLLLIGIIESRHLYRN